MSDDFAAAIRQPRERDNACPSWCPGHNEIYQPWEVTHDGPTERLTREHFSECESIGGVDVGLGTREHIGHLGLLEHSVAVYTNTDAAAELTADQARRLASLLLAAAQQLDDALEVSA